MVRSDIASFATPADIPYRMQNVCLHTYGVLECTPANMVLTSALVAGHDTTAITLAWFLYNVALYPTIQEKLRDELLSIPTDHPTMEELSSLHYLDCVLREVVRLFPVLPSSLRVATEDTPLPLGESVNINGQAQDRIWCVSSFPRLCAVG